MPEPSASVRKMTSIRRMYDNGANVNQICRKLDLMTHTVQSLLDLWYPQDAEPAPKKRTRAKAKPKTEEVVATDEFS